MDCKVFFHLVGKTIIWLPSLTRKQLCAIKGYFFQGDSMKYDCEVSHLNQFSFLLFLL